MATTKVNITKAPSGGKYQEGTTIEYELEGAAKATKNVDKDSNTVTIAGLGTFTANGDKVSFTADAALNGTLDFSSSTASVDALDFSATTGGISYAVDADDTSVKLGAGADTIDIQTGTATVNGYSYEDNDVISVASGQSATYTLSASGDFTGAAGATVKVSTDGTQIYKAKATDDQGSTQYWTGVAEGTANAFDASSVSDKIIIDASTSKKADVKLGSGKSSVTIGAGTVASGSSDDSISVEAGGALTLSIGRNDGKDTVNAIGASDTIIFEDGKLSRIDSIETNKITYAQTQVSTTAALGDTFKVQFGTDASTLGKLQWAAAGATLEAATDTTYFYGADNITTLKAADGKVSYNLSDSSHFHNIHYVTLGAKTSGAVTLTNDNDTIVSAATDALTLTLGQGNDSVSLASGNRKAATIVTSAVSGQDKIENFKTGFADTSDILQISDLSSLDDITIGKKADGTAAAGQIFFDEKDYISLDGSITDEGLLVKFADSDAVKKVAAALNGGDTITVASDDADIVLGNKDGSTTYSVGGGKKGKETTFDLRDKAKYKNIYKIDLSGYTGDQVVIGTTDVDTISLGSETAKVWGGGSESDTIALKSGHTGAAQIWYGAGDGSDTVTNFTDGDAVYFYGARTAGDIAKGFTFSGDASNVKITNKADKHDTLTLSGTFNKPLTVQYYTADGEVEKTAVSFVAGGAAATFTTDSLIYVGTATNTSVKAPSTLDNEKVEYKVDLRGDAGSWNAKFYGINTFDASDSYAQYALIGSGKSTLKGGKTLNAYWGGDSDSQIFEGQKGVTDYFWFGAGDGHDTVTKGVDTKDVVYIWSTKDINDVKVTVSGDDVDVIYANENDLTLKDALAAVKSGLTFMTQDQSKYTYDIKTQSFKEKKA